VPGFNLEFFDQAASAVFRILPHSAPLSTWRRQPEHRADKSVFRFWPWPTRVPPSCLAGRLWFTRRGREC